MYVPQQGRKTGKKGQFCNNFHKFYEMNDGGANKIIMGDWNKYVSLSRKIIDQVLL